jgi:hypothetical protein
MMPAAFDPTWWTLCHSGWWIHGNNGYVWVAGGKMHHHLPIHWIRFGKTVAFVPLHPKDVRGQLPVNREYGFTVSKERGGTHVLNPIKFEGPHSVETLKSAPREFRNEPASVLARVEAPHMEMHAVRDSMTARAGTPTTAIPLHFDHQTGGFMAPHQVAQGGHSSTVFAPVGHSGGGYQGHSGGGSYGGGGGARAAGGGGGSSGGGGGFHGGGTSSPSSGSTISVSSGAGVASNGSHH